jgi:hypothetical protein
MTAKFHGQIPEEALTRRHFKFGFGLSGKERLKNYQLEYRVQVSIVSHFQVSWQPWGSHSHHGRDGSFMHDTHHPSILLGPTDGRMARELPSPVLVISLAGGNGTTSTRRPRCCRPPASPADVFSPFWPSPIKVMRPVYTLHTATLLVCHLRVNDLSPRGPPSPSGPIHLK